MNYAGQSITFEIEGNKIMKAIQIVAPDKVEIVDVVPIENLIRVDIAGFPTKEKYRPARLI